ncbi:MAG: DUF4258 domain-containing protein [Deltaproteobacteria bacterium]|nr:DUF4258 domain-containing protein [Deltaproteobacteria bacterium]
MAEPMTPSEKGESIRTAAAASLAGRPGAVLWSSHALQRLVAHRLDRRQVETALACCEVIEDYPEGHRGLPDCLAFGLDSTGLPVHAVVAMDRLRDRVLVVTAYRPRRERWADDWKTRR